jgi:hypothetical protein
MGEEGQPMPMLSVNSLLLKDLQPHISKTNKGTAFAYGAQTLINPFIYHRILSGRRRILKLSSTRALCAWPSFRVPLQCVI